MTSAAPSYFVAFLLSLPIPEDQCLMTIMLFDDANLQPINDKTSNKLQKIVYVIYKFRQSQFERLCQLFAAF